MRSYETHVSASATLWLHPSSPTPVGTQEGAGSVWFVPSIFWAPLSCGAFGPPSPCGGTPPICHAAVGHLIWDPGPQMGAGRSLGGRLWDTVSQRRAGLDSTVLSASRRRSLVISRRLSVWFILHIPPADIWMMNQHWFRHTGRWWVKTQSANKRQRQVVFLFEWRWILPRGVSALREMKTALHPPRCPSDMLLIYQLAHWRWPLKWGGKVSKWRGRRLCSSA